MWDQWVSLCGIHLGGELVWRVHQYCSLSCQHLGVKDGQGKWLDSVACVLQSTHPRPLQRMVSGTGSIWLVPLYPPGPNGSSLQLQNENVGFQQKAGKGVINSKKNNIHLKTC